MATPTTPARDVPCGGEVLTREKKWHAGAMMAQMALLMAVGWLRRHALNPDGVAYIRIAGYYLHGPHDLAVTGYWGPVLSWLMMPWLALGWPPLVAARVAMGLSAVVFLWGCMAVFRVFQLPRWLENLGVWMAVGLSVGWSVENISPDLLAAGISGLAFSLMLKPGWLEQPGVAVGAGLLWGLAYLTKAAAFPQAILIISGLAVTGYFRNGRRFKRVISSAALTVFCWAAIAGPWVAVVSAKYHELTISRSAELNHAMAGPPDIDRFYPFDRGFYQPESGRVTFWEDPDLPYPDWSPIANMENAIWQAKVMARNLPVVIIMLTSVCLVFPWLLVAFPVRWVNPGWRAALSGQGWWLSLIPIAAMALPYLGGNLLVTEQRYFYGAYPFLLVASAGIVFLWRPAGTRMRPGGLALVMFALAFLLPTLARPPLWRRPATTAGECGWVLAQKLMAAHITGPVAGSASLSGGRAGLYVAFQLGQSWLGDPRVETASAFEASGAQVVVLRRNDPVCADMERDPHFHDLDAVLFGPVEGGMGFPLKAYELAKTGAN